MEFDFNSINLLSQEPYLKINSHTSLFYVTEKHNQSKVTLSPFQFPDVHINFI